MSLDWVSKPLTGDSPAGPDLWEADDAEYGDYYFSALDRIDITYVKPGMDSATVFDPADVDLKSELSSIDALLQRSRDLRLLSLRARWAILAGKLAPCVESVEAMADLMAEMPEHVLPTLADGPADRLEAFNDLSHQETMLQPLRHLNLANTPTTYRLVTVARGEMTAREDEQDVDLGALMRELSYAKEETHQDRLLLKRFRNALHRINGAITSGPKPQFAPLDSLLSDILALLDAAVPDQAPAQVTQPPETPETNAVSAPEATATAAPTMVPAPPQTEIKSQQEAAARLRAVEQYFRHFEPSSAALLLVTQSRMLLGKSLIEAFEVLMPDTAARAAINFAEDSGFRLSHGHLRALSDQAMSVTTPPPVAVAPEPETAVEPAPAPEPAPEPEGPRKLSIDEILGMHESGSAAPKPAPAASEPKPELKSAQTAPVATGKVPAFVPLDPEDEDALMAEAARFPVLTSQEAQTELLSIESYFRAVERSSPIPMLLSKARSYIGKDFETLMRELIPRQP
ncbi:type VI secretion system ImpA family N-terminal domain-containing protein [Celeribacter naphthalenivorans]|uniref:type VI secretion system ImpA family N-terminal domain-containing protein n=1 Tax=Celeribacter naphthalenivorans TaxID=1614694 RepID=UPI001CFAA369|nr:type VI secretion system ImpA family N-terminal domain-containing protein [Celeribacter naphthalenivorans]